jgi:hypothetical protein
MSRTKEIFTKEGTVTKRLAMILGIVMGMVIAATSMANPAYAMRGVQGEEWQEALEDGTFAEWAIAGTIWKLTVKPNDNV